jgi:cation diffusion facilitator family transporter
MHVEKMEMGNRQIRFITNVSIVSNLALSVMKFAVGLLAGSIALIADGVHSLSDMATDVAVLLGVHFGSKKADECHPYGHGRIETFSAAFVGVALAIVGAGMIYRAALDITAGKTVRPSVAVLVAAVISIIAKEVLYQATRKVAVRSHSSALYANAWHHRSDALSSIAVLVGWVVLRFGFKYGDQIAAVAVGLMVILVAVQVIGNCLGELTEAAIDPEIIENIKQIVNSDEQIRQWHQLRSRMVGREVFLDLHILVDPELTIGAAHGIADGLEKTLHEQITHPVNITVHIEPDVPSLRR